MLEKCMRITALTILLIIIMLNVVGNISYSAGNYSSTMSGLINNMDNAKASDGGKALNSVNKVVATIVTIARIIGVTVAIVMLLVVAMKYMSAAPGEKADIKKSAVVYVVGAIVLFAVTGILGIINNFSSNITKK